jgi:predicted negative regulator of RcsB-dependent stress response
MDKLAISRSMKQNIKLIILITITLAIILLCGRLWINNQKTRSAQASQIYQEMLFAEYQKDKNTVAAKGEQLMSSYSRTPYSQLAALLLAKNSVAENNLDEAATKLRWAIDHNASKKILVPIATAHLALVLQQQGKLDEALDLVSSDPDKAYISLYAQVRGDIYVAKGDVMQAKAAYIQALENLAPGVQAPLLQLKLMDLGVDDNA